MAILLALVDHSFLAPYNSSFGQLVLALIAVLYGLGIWWLRRLARFESPQRLLGDSAVAAGVAEAGVVGAGTVRGGTVGAGPVRASTVRAGTGRGGVAGGRA
jgi:hypothetical protein